jgi:hypothetical protein
MTTNQYEHHKDQIDAMRRDFRAWWHQQGKGNVMGWLASSGKATTDNIALCEGFSWEAWKAAKGYKQPK